MTDELETKEEPESQDSQRIRQTFVAGLFAFVPLAVTAFILWWVDERTRVITEKLFGRAIPFLGVLITLAAIYLTGMITTSLLGKFLLRVLDGVLMRLPVVRQLYLVWKQIALTPGGTEGTFSRVVVIPDETGNWRQIGFTSGRVVDVEVPSLCVFVPSCPNPITGRLFFVPVEKCKIVNLTPEEAFKVILSTGNYIPPLLPGDPARLTANPTVQSHA
jgi:uncharacterized membrane protein